MGEKTYEFMREWTKSPKERLQDVTPSSWWGPEVPGTTGPANVTPTDPDTAARILQGPDASAPTLQMPERPKIPMGIDSAPGAAVAPKEISPADWPITRTGDTTQATTPQAPATAQGSPWDDYMKSLRDERQELKDLILGQQKDRSAQEAENRNIALMKAGFGMMAGQSPFAGVNIGRGAMEGAEAYGKGLEQLRAGDRETIKQLVAMGFKGQELQNEAKRLGITEEYYRAHYPVLAAQARETEAKIPGLKATAGYTEAKTAAMPGEQALEERKVAADEYRALHPLRAAGAGAGKLGGIDPQAVKIQTEIRNSWIDQPLNPSNPFAKELQTRIAQDPRLAVALRGKPGDVLYDNAIARVVAPMAQKYADALQQGSMRQPVGYTDGSNEE